MKTKYDERPNWIHEMKDTLQDNMKDTLLDNMKDTLQDNMKDTKENERRKKG